MKERVVVAMSGGVDSSVAAAWLKHEGYDVVGISLQLHDLAENEENEFGSCCSLSDLNDARRVADRLGIPFYVTDMEKAFQGAVIDDFVSEYLLGRTPNPCVRCNEKVKFHKLMDWAMDLGASYLATGHYAQIKDGALLKGADPEKDQSYFLFTLKKSDLARTMFPVGNLTKPEVRALAEKYGLATAHKPDSQEICFVQAKSYKEFVEAAAPPEALRPGEIVDPEGKVLGRHDGLHGYTIGQRKGLNVGSLVPLYVLRLDAAKNQVVVGPEEKLFRRRATVSHLNWIEDAPTTAAAKIRYRAKESPVELKSLGEGRAEVHFSVPQRAIAPGQAMVFYEGDRVLGGGWIEDLAID